MSLSHRPPHAGVEGDPYYVYAPPPLHPDPHRQGVLTLFIAGLPDDVKPREIHNLFSHRPGFDHCLLEYTGRGNQVRHLPSRSTLGSWPLLLCAERSPTPSRRTLSYIRGGPVGNGCIKCADVYRVIDKRVNRTGGSDDHENVGDEWDHEIWEEEEDVGNDDNALKCPSAQQQPPFHSPSSPHKKGAVPCPVPYVESRPQSTLVLDGMPAERLDVSVASRELVRASNPPPGFPATLAVSNLDLILGSFHVYLINIYPSPPTAGFPAVLTAVRAALPTFLSHFFPFAGRIVTNASTGLPEIACTNAGAELVVADAGAAPLADVDLADSDRSISCVALPFARGLALSLQLVRFACGGFALAWGTDHLLVDGHGLTALPNAWAELLIRAGGGGGLSSWAHRERADLFRPRDPPRYGPSLDAEFTRYHASGLPNALLTATFVRRNYVVSAADVDRLRAAASSPARRATRLEALSAHVWKLLAAAVGASDTRCRMAWLVDGRRRLDPARFDPDVVRRYLGNVVTYASREAVVESISSSTLADVAAMAGAAIAEVFRSERFEELVDWMEERKWVYREGGKWTEVVGVGTGSPALVVSAFVPFKVDGGISGSGGRGW
ncbi:hypothetical protein PR202_ga18132 [Eleusine coracana subsp. coracana]|uniref:Uncharacterized protein n=1 Tax=Eleusine coracana subsp. coracana TaxID=191504 RepID=A0AAV5CRY0_ELECO|nr:hypothetical protein PR202_ga18132 [Eleusine coracana subsp. coracana]